MARTRRTLLTGLGTFAVAGLAGCIDEFAGESGEPAHVPGDVAEELGYELADHETLSVEDEVEGEDVDTEFLITGYQKVVENPMSDEDVTAIYAIISTPSVERAGQELNPLVHLSTEEVMDHVDGFDDLNIELREHTAGTDIPHERLDQTIAVEHHEASVATPALRFRGTLITGVIETDDSILLGIGGFSDQLDETDAIHTLLAHTETTARVDADGELISGGSSADDPGGTGTGGWDSDEEFPNHIHLRNMADEQTVAMTLRYEGESVYDDAVDVAAQMIETVPDVLHDTGGYELDVEAAIGTQRAAFELLDSTADIGVILTEDDELVISDIAARSADRYDDTGDHDDDGDSGEDTSEDRAADVVVVNRTSSSTTVDFSIHRDGEAVIESQTDVPAEGSRAFEEVVTEVGTYEVEAHTGDAEVTESVELTDLETDLLIEVTQEDELRVHP